MTATYPKMLTGTDVTSGKTVPLVYPFNQNHPKQGTMVVFKTLAEEQAYDGTGVPASSVTGAIENKHHV